MLFSVVDGGTAWLRESFDISPDTVDGMHGGVEPWHGLVDQLRQDLASIILMSEADLQVCLKKKNLSSLQTKKESKKEQVI